MNIIIVGGGTAGWMSAAALSKQGHEVTIFRGNEPIGVGESTTPHIDQYLKYMGISDEDFLRATRGTYKSSSRFVDFYKKGHVFHYPNGQSDQEFDVPFDHWMQAKRYYPDQTPPFAEFFQPFVGVAEDGKLPIKDPLLEPYDLSKDRSFHIDGSKFAAYLQENFCSNVRVDDRKVTSVRYNGDRISSLFLERGPYDNRAPQTDADFYIDCTGQASTLGGAQSQWVEYDTILPDTALVTRREYSDKDKEMVPYTQAKGMNAGWKWTIPTWDYISEGYVYSSKHITEEEARQEFGDGNIIKFRNGRYEDAWVGNCVKIGLSYGFIEPLESTSLFNTGHGILMLCDLLEEGHPGSFARDRFNTSLREHMDGWREFVEAHYYYSARRDTPFWEDVTCNVKYEQLHNYNQYFAQGSSAHDVIGYYAISGHPIDVKDPIFYIYAGSEFSNVRKRHVDYFKTGTSVDEYTVAMWYDHNQRRHRLAESMPSMHKYLKDTVFS